MERKRAIVAEFIKSAGGRLTMFALTTVETEMTCDGREYLARTIYDVAHSRRYGYIFHQSGGGGDGPVQVQGIYFTSGQVDVRETPCQLVHGEDRPPWRGKRTRAIRKLNRTRPLRALPKAFALGPGDDLLDWLEHHAINQESVWCSVCRDEMPEDSLCDHCWWCEATGQHSTPDERCGCKSRAKCYGE